MKCKFSTARAIVVAPALIAWMLIFSGGSQLIAEDPPAADPPAAESDDPPASPGQAALDKATSLKIAAESFADLGRVIEFCEEAINKGLDDENRKFAEQLLAGSRIDRANRICAEIFERDPPNENWQQLARAALIDLELAVRQRPDIAEAHFMIGRIHALPGGNARRAVGAFDKVIQFAGPDMTLKSRALTLRGDAREDAAAKMADYDEALKLDSNHVGALRARGLLYMQLDEHDKAVKDLRRAIELEPEHAKTHEVLAVELILSEKVDEAKATLDRAIKLAPKEATAYAHRARVYLMQKEYEKALADISHALEEVPNGLTWILLREIYEQQEEYEKALADVDTVLKIEPNLLEAVRRRATLLVALDRLKDAVAELELVVEGNPQQLELRLLLGMMYHSSRQPRKAIEQFDAVAAANVKHWSLFRNRADALLSIGRQAEALEDYKAALKLKPEDPGILNNLAWLLSTSPRDELRDGPQAVDLANKAAKATEYKEAYILSTLAAAYAETGDFESAVKWSQKALDLTEDDIKSQLADELKSFKAQKPWRESQNIEAEN